MIRLSKKTILTLLAGLLIIFVTSCMSTKKFEKEEESLIQDYLAKNPDLDFELKPSGLYYLDILTGTGPAAETHDTAYIFYAAKYLNGNTFDTNVGTTDTLITPVNEGYLIAGFDEGISYMKEGGKSQLIVPSYLGYGQSGYRFPAYTPVLFEVDLVKVVQGP
jgi:FKBP-type peptidyl-prolyl cis-trans isomerase